MGATDPADAAAALAWVRAQVAAGNYRVSAHAHREEVTAP